ncbi:hypothetical protein EBU71_06490 [bacterium]|jgi:hypothetical protein|nr:hypothetical protein [Candidatus Elulimicrobium humile]
MTITQGLVETENEEPGFEITHLSFRKRRSENMYGGPVDYYIGNIVFRLTDENAKGRMEYIMKENERVRVAPDEELHNKYYDGLHFKFHDEEEDATVDEDGQKFYPLEILNKEGIKDEDVFIWAYRRNMDPLHDFIEYIEKFDCYRMHEYFQDTPVVRGIIQYLQDMKDGKPNPSRTVYHEQFLSTLTNLCWWWD